MGLFRLTLQPVLRSGNGHRYGKQSSIKRRRVSEFHIKMGGVTEIRINKTIKVSGGGLTYPHSTTFVSKLYPNVPF